MDGIVYGVTVSLGFATLENIYYVFAGFDDPLGVAYLRAFSAVPAHALFGVFMGYYFMKYSFIKRKNSLFFAYLISYFCRIIITCSY